MHSHSFYNVPDSATICFRKVEYLDYNESYVFLKFKKIKTRPKCHCFALYTDKQLAYILYVTPVRFCGGRSYFETLFFRVDE